MHHLCTLTEVSHHPSELNLPLALEASVGIVFGGGVNTAAEVGASGRQSICIPNIMEQTENCKAMQALWISTMVPAADLTSAPLSAEQAAGIKEALNKLWEFGRQQRLSEIACRCQAEDGLTAFVHMCVCVSVCDRHCDVDSDDAFSTG